MSIKITIESDEEGVSEVIKDFLHSISHGLRQETSQLGRQLDRVERKLNLIQKEQKQIMADLTALEEEVTATAEGEASAVVLLEGIISRLEAAGTDQNKINALVSQLSASKDALAAAVAAVPPA